MRTSRNLVCGRSYCQRWKGFTLVEILVVVAVLAILALIAFQAGTKFVTRARISQSSMNLRSLAMANTVYQAENGEFCPAVNQSNTRRWCAGPGGAGGGFDPTQGYLSPYLGSSRSVGICPLFKDIVTSGSFELGTGGYGYNSSYIGGRPDGKWSSTKILVPEKMINLTDPSKTVMFTTTAYAQPEGLQEYPWCEPPSWPSGGRPSPTVHFRADGRALVAWCDGHISAEVKNDIAAGENPHGGDAGKLNLGWFGPEENNGHWNSRQQ